MKVVVVGINHAGTSAIRTLLAQNPNVEINAYDRNDNISFLACGIALTVSGVVSNPQELFYSDPNALEKLGASIFMSHDVTKVDAVNKTVTVKDLATGEIKQDSYDKLIYAAGSWPIEIPNLPEQASKLKNIKMCKLYQHAKELIELGEDPSIQNIVVVGAGYIGIELTEAFHQRGKNVTLVDYADRVIAHYFDSEFTDSLESKMREDGVALALNQKVIDFKGENGYVTTVVTDKGEYKADLVIKAIGFKPNTELLVEAAKLPNGAVIVDEHMETSIPDVYCIGDAAALTDAITNKPVQIALATNAVKTGIAAASAINGINQVVLKNVAGTNAISVFNHNLAGTGISETVAKSLGFDYGTSYVSDADKPEFMGEYNEVKFKIIYDKTNYRLLGAQVGSCNEANHAEIMFYFALAIQQGLTLIDLAFTDVYFLPHYNKPFNFMLTAILNALDIKYQKAAEPEMA